MTAIAAAALSLTTPSVFAATTGGAQHSSYRPTYSCTVDSWTHVVSSIDWLRVHTSPSASSTTIGLLAGGTAFSFCSSSEQINGGLLWVYGYGYHGTVKLSGWVAGEYLIWP